jgi:hypothetical protein
LSIGQLHWSAANYAPLQEWAQVKGLAACYTEGLVREVGVSNYGAKQLRKVFAANFSMIVDTIALENPKPVWSWILCCFVRRFFGERGLRLDGVFFCIVFKNNRSVAYFVEATVV